MDREKPEASFTIAVPQQVNAFLVSLANRERRTKKHQVLVIIEDYMRRNSDIDTEQHGAAA